MHKIFRSGIRILCCLWVAALLCGCSLEFASPDSLIAAPASNQERLQQKQLVTSFLSPEEALIVPEGLENHTAYQKIDLNQDGEEEIVAFYTNKENKFLLGFLVLEQRDGTWELGHKVTAYGTDIHYFAAHDLDQDGNTELLLGVDTGYGSQKELYLYRLAGGDLLELSTDDRIAYDQLTLVPRQNGDVAIVTARMDTTVLEGSSNITAYCCLQNAITPVYDDVFSGYCNEMEFARVAPETDGVYMAMLHNHFLSVLLLTEQGESFSVVMEEALPYEYEDMRGTAIFYDENGDGILEIRSLWEPEGNDTTKGVSDYIKVWLRWDGADGVEAVDAVLENSNEGYRLQIPLDWLDVLYYEFRTGEHVSWVDFYSETEEQTFTRAFSFAAIDQLVWEEMDPAETTVVLGNNPEKNKIYVADIPNVPADTENETSQGFQVDASRLISCLQIEGGERR